MQGFNMGRYHPPDSAGVLNPNKLHGKHPLGKRASKLSSEGSLVVRFEMPFPVWCSSCPKPTIIAQGVRFNAAKKRIGSYFTTPIFSFRMKHAVCGGDLEIQTDPKNTAYVVVSGGKRREVGSDDSSSSSLVPSSSDFVIPTAREREEERESAFGKLEKTIADRERFETGKRRIGELRDDAERKWENPYELNRRLRREFRAGRKEREEEAGRTDELRDRMSLGIDLLPGTDEDEIRAKLVDFRPATDDTLAREALARPLFSNNTTVEDGRKGKEVGGEREGKKRLRSEIAADKIRQSLVSEIVGNTRAARDPFLGFGSSSTREEKERIMKGRGPGPFRLSGIKRKRAAATATAEAPGPPAQDEGNTPDTPAKVNTSLVDYGSDSD